MKTINFLAVLAFSATMLMVTSCNKTDEFPTAIDYINEITGSYEGTLTSNNLKIGGETAYAEIRHLNGIELEIHCYGDLLDTTFVMEIYANNDSVMLCATDGDFEHLYGHSQGEYHMSHHGNNQSEWTHHMADNHSAGEQHYGGFHISNHSFNYRFIINKDLSSEIITFEGIRVE